MKSLAAAIALFYFASTMAAAPYGIKGQQQTSTLYSNVHQFPNNQVTNMGGIDALVETGNNNILSNPSFEHLTVSSGWTDSGTDTGIATAVAVVNGKKAIGFLPVARSVNLTQSSTLYASQFADGVQGLAMVRIKSDVALKVCSIQAGVVSTTNCVITNTDLKWGLYKVPFILGGTSNGISISTNGTLVTGTVIVDDAFVGAVDLKQDINNVGNWISFTPTGSWVSNTTYTGKYRQVGEDLEVYYYWATSGAPTATQLTLNLPTGFTIDTTKLLLGTTKEVLDSDGGTSDSDLNFPAITAFYNTTSVITVGASTVSGINVTDNGGVTATLPFTWGANDKGILRVKVPVTQFAGSSSVYTSTNADTDWASCGHTTSDFTGFGTVTGINISCKRQGSDLLMRGRFITGVNTATEARLSMKFNGSTLTSKSLPAPVYLVGDMGVNTQSTTYFRSSVLSQPSLTYLSFSNQTSTGNLDTLMLGTGIANSSSVNIDARIPINGWENSNIIIGSFNGLQTCVDTLSCTDTFSAKVSAAGVVSGENVDWINGNASITDISKFGIPINAGIFTVTPNCWTSMSADISGVSQSAVTDLTSTSSTNTSVRTLSGGGKSAQPFTITCQKSGADYIGKTAMAVASDQNVRSIGSTNVDIQSVYFGGNGTCSTACTTGTCIICNKTGNKISSVSWSSTGAYNINGIDGTKYNCTGSAAATGYAGIVHLRNSSTSSYARVEAGSGTGTLANAAYANVNCIGIP